SRSHSLHNIQSFPTRRSSDLIITTAGSKEKLDFCRSLGADVCINYKEQDFDQEVLKATNNKGADLILDFIGASYWKKNLDSIKIDRKSTRLNSSHVSISYAVF